MINNLLYKHNIVNCLLSSQFHLERESCVVIVTSTTGDGEPPDTALKFYRRLRKKTLSDDYLSKLNYALLGYIYFLIINF